MGIADQIGCERKRCEWIETDDASDCALTTETPTVESGCCAASAGESAKKNEMCNGKASREKCERGKGCDWREGEDADCSFEPEAGCCYGEGVKQCSSRDSEVKCVRSNKCEWRAGEEADCSYTEEAGCCKSATRKYAEMCAAKEEREKCQRTGKCEWIETDDDSECEWQTTTSEPWIAAKVVDRRFKSHLSHREDAQYQQETELFGSGVKSVANQALYSQISLSTVLLATVVILTVFLLYRWYVSNNRGKYIKIRDPQGSFV